MGNDKQILNESKLSLSGKLFFAGVASYLAGKFIKGVVKGMKEDDSGLDSSSSGPEHPIPHIPLKIKGTQEQIDAMTKVIATSKDYQDSVTTPGSTIEDVLDKLRQKNVAKQDFERITKKTWPL